MFFSGIVFSFPQHLEVILKREYECLPVKLRIHSFVAHTWNILAKSDCLTDVDLNPGFAIYCVVTLVT